jgi:hypothetical protein
MGGHAMWGTMFKASNSTVFILGAGASWHYGYPTGETLVEKVIEKAAIALRYFEHSIKCGNSQLPEYLVGKQWEKAAEECQKLKNGLRQVKPLVIDYYLGWNADVQDIGRLLIAWVIMECEQLSKNGNLNRYLPKSSHTANTQNYYDDWVRFIVHQIAIHCRESSDLLENKVSFVTFNYDVSLEARLRNGLGHIQLFSASDVTKFLSGTRIVHVYGKIRDENAKSNNIPWEMQEQDPNMLGVRTGDYHMAMKNLLDAANAASKGLRVIDPHDKGAYDIEIMMARRAIAEAQRIFILGYGFDEHNSDRLALRDQLANSVGGTSRVAFTNYGDINQINKRASKLVYRHSGGFQPGGPSVTGRYEKSIRNTYDALAMDFDLAD